MVYTVWWGREERYSYRSEIGYHGDPLNKSSPLADSLLHRRRHPLESAAYLPLYICSGPRLTHRRRLVAFCDFRSDDYIFFIIRSSLLFTIIIISSSSGSSGSSGSSTISI